MYLFLLGGNKEINSSHFKDCLTRRMSANVPRVADVARKGYKIKCDKKVSPRAPCGNGVNVLLFKNLFIILFNSFLF